MKYNIALVTLASLNISITAMDSSNLATTDPYKTPEKSEPSASAFDTPDEDAFLDTSMLSSVRTNGSPSTAQGILVSPPPAPFPGIKNRSTIESPPRPPRSFVLKPVVNNPSGSETILGALVIAAGQPAPIVNEKTNLLDTRRKKKLDLHDIELVEKSKNCCTLL